VVADCGLVVVRYWLVMIRRWLNGGPEVAWW